MEVTTVFSRSFPETTALQLNSWHLDDTDTLITLHVTSTQQVVPCPVCAVFTHRVHSRYTRMLADLPWGVARVRWQLRVRKFVCANAQCPRQIVTERLPDVVAPWARRTRRLVAWLIAIGLALGGAAGVRLSRRLGCTLSRQTFFRMIRRLPLPCHSMPRVLGVDDFAFRKRQRYGTVLIDLERRQPVALLPDREANTLAQWLQAHPGVEIIARDRAKAYADGARQGAPEATQVADRFHLLQNMVEALEQVFQTHHQALAAVNDTIRGQGVSLADGTTAVAVPPPPPTGQEKTAQRRARRVECHQQVWALHDQGWPGHAMATHLGIGKNTVFRYLRTTTLPERRRRRDRGHSLLNPYTPYLLDRWNAGCHDALHLFGELQQRGYPGSYATVARYAQRLRQVPRQRPPRQTLPVVVEPRQPLLTARQAAWLVLRREEPRGEEEAQPLTQLRAQHGDVAEAIDLAQDVARLVRQRQGAQLDTWMARVAKSTIAALQRFAKGLADDYDAVKAGLTLPWSNGPVEGQITRLKRLKRQMFGRASLALLERRFVLAPERLREPVPHPQEPSEVQAQPAAASPYVPRRSSRVPRLASPRPVKTWA
jgi:transposase